MVAFFNYNPEGQQGGTFDIMTSTGCLGEKKIGLIEEKGDQFLFDEDGIYTVMVKLTNMPKYFLDYAGYLLYNKTLNKTHYMYAPTGFTYQNKLQNVKLLNVIEPWTFSDYIFRPFMLMNGSVSLDSGGSINIWDWAKNDSNLQASYWIEERKNDSAESYNVICEVEGKNPNKTILISGGHHDFHWGQGASDNAAGIAIMLGILKWLNESGITPEFNLTFVTFSGEECGDRGSSVHVFDEFFASKNKNITYMINLDWLAHNTAESILTIPVTDETLKTAINHTTSRTHYKEKFENITNKKYKIKVLFGEVGNDAAPFYDRYIDGLFDAKDITDLKIIGLEKEKRRNEKSEVIYARHRSGANHTLGDTVTIIDRE